MDRKIKLLAATVAAITTAACTPQGGPNSPYNQQTQGSTYSGSTTSSVTHSHSGKVHAHLLPATGIRHTHNTGTGGSTTYTAPTTYRPPAVSNNGGMTHSHSGKVHTHKLPTTGINHTHRVGGGSSSVAANTRRPPAATNTRPPAAHHNTQVAARDPNAHSHNGRVHSHRLPASGLNHAHRMGGSSGGQTSAPVANTTYRPPAANTYRPPANNYRPPANNSRPPPGNNSGGTAHNHNGRTHSHRLPASGTNHAHNTGGGGSANPVRTQPSNQPSNNSGNYGYYDYSGNNAATNNNTATSNTATNNTAATNNSNYYDYSSSGSSSTYYDTTRPKGSANYSANTNTTANNNSNYYDYSSPSSSNTTTSSNYTPKTSTGSFLPNNYTGGNNYTVQRGDTVFQVMRNTGVYWKDIIRINNLKAPNYQIVPGQTLRLR